MSWVTVRWMSARPHHDVPVESATTAAAAAAAAAACAEATDDASQEGAGDGFVVALTTAPTGR